MRILTDFASGLFQCSGKKTAKTGRCFLSLQRNSFSKQEGQDPLQRKEKHGMT